jgi:NAD(P)-dependent dehydrogenase (short-subunit alcohol dehydrogenase family)
MPGTFAESVVIVAGGTGALGQAVSLAFLSQGARVLVTYRKRTEYDELRQAAAGGGGNLEGREIDVTDEASVRTWIGEVRGTLGRVDVLVNTVGAYAGGQKLWEEKDGLLDRMLDVNLRSGYALSRAAVPVMLAQKRGALVNVASKAAFEPSAGIASYAASKAAAVALWASLASELKGTGVRANSIVPSVIDTVENRRAMPKAAFDKWPKPEEIARVVLFLASDDAKVVQGAAVPVYGDS